MDQRSDRFVAALLFTIVSCIVGPGVRMLQALSIPVALRENRLTVAALFNDRTPLAWVIVGCYFAAAAAAFWARGVTESRERHFWLATGILLILLGLNKELDLQAVLTEQARALARYLGLYEERRQMQGVFLLVLTVAALLAAMVLGAWLRRSSKPAKAAAAGIVLLFAFVLMRAASFHHIDHWVTIEVAGLRSGWWLELAGIAVIGISAAIRRGRKLWQQSR